MKVLGDAKSPNIFYPFLFLYFPVLSETWRLETVLPFVKAELIW